MRGQSMRVKLRLDRDGYVYADGLRLCRVTGTGELEFCDRNNLRSKGRGTRLLTIQVADLVEISLKQSDENSLPP